jgi:hypothetical protein
VENKERDRWGNEISDLLDWGRDCGQVVKNMSELKTAVEDGLAQPEKKSDIRKEFAKKFFYNPGEATDTALSKIYEWLEIPPPA